MDALTTPRVDAESLSVSDADGGRPTSIDHRRLGSPSTTWALVTSFVAAIGVSLGAVFIGRVAVTATRPGVAVLGALVVGLVSLFSFRDRRAGEVHDVDGDRP